MCELFAMNASRPGGVGRALATLMPRGGDTGPHGDGWGVAYYEDRAARIFKDSAPAAGSRHMALLAEQDPPSHQVIAHIRKANPSVFGRSTANTHPFEREWRGRSWVFAHNGKLPEVKSALPMVRGRFRPLGSTDSEHAFCLIMNTIAGARRFATLRSDESPEPGTLIRFLRPMVHVFAALGEFNFLLSDGETLYCHAHTRLHEHRRRLHTPDGPVDRVLLATRPLSDGPWRALAPGSFTAYRHGRALTADASPLLTAA